MDINDYESGKNREPDFLCLHVEEKKKGIFLNYSS